MSGIQIRDAGLEDVPELSKMCADLWPDGSEEEHAADVRKYIASGRYGSMETAFLLAQSDDGEVTGFLHVGMRSHADGCDVEQPVGFIEGWFVKPGFRGRGFGAALMHAAEDWARRQGCRELASDTWIDHVASQNAHQALGFETADRCIHFRKNL